MPTWIVFLRGINVGGKNKLPMQALTADLEAIGCADVRTYIQSGNAVVRSSQRSAGRLRAAIAERLEAEHGFAPGVQVLTAAEFRAAIGANPFPEAAPDPKSLHAYFLAKKPKAADLDGLARLQGATERFVVTDRVFYLHAPDGVGRSKLAASVERLLGVETTARNWRTVLALADLVESA